MADTTGQWFVVLNDYISKNPSAISDTNLKNFWVTIQASVKGQEDALNKAYIKNGTLIPTAIDWSGLKTSQPDIYTSLVKLGVIKETTPSGTWIRDYLNGKGIDTSRITWDAKTKTVLVDGKPFMSTGFNIGSDNKAYATPEVLDTALNKFTGSNLNVQGTTTGTGEPPVTPPTGTEPVVPTGEPDYSTWSNQKLSDEVQKATLQGQVNTYKDILKLLNPVDENGKPIPSPMIAALNDAYGQLIDSGIKGLEVVYNSSKAALESQKGQVNANYAGALHDINVGIMSARARTKTDMNSRGMLFSSVLTTALGQVEAAGITAKAQTIAHKTADLNAIASQIAVLTSNKVISEDALKQNYLAQAALKVLDITTTNENNKLQIEEALAGVNNQIATLEGTTGVRGEQAKRTETAQKAEQKLSTDERLAKMGLNIADTNQVYANISLNLGKFDLAQAQFTWQTEIDKANYNLKADQLLIDTTQFLMNLQQNKDLALAKIVTSSTTGTKENPQGLAGLLGMSMVDLTTLKNKITSTAVQIPMTFEQWEANLGTDISKLNDTQLANEKASYNAEIAKGGVPMLPKLEAGDKNYVGLISTLQAIYLDGANISIDNMPTFTANIFALAKAGDVNSGQAIIDNISDPAAKVIADIVFFNKGNLTNIQSSFFGNTDIYKEQLKSAGIADADIDDYFVLLEKAFGMYGGH